MRFQSSSRQSLTAGASVGQLAQQLFPGGINAAPDSYFEFDKSVALTRQLIGQRTKVIYEAAFRHGDLFVACDILVRGRRGWKVFEVKSSTEVSDTYVLDTSFQYFVLRNAGIDLEDISIIFINSDYVRKGELNLHQLFSIQSVIEEVKRNQETVRAKIEELRSVLNMKAIPNIDIGPHCNDPYPCDFMGHCWKHIPDISVFNLTRLRTEKKFALYSQGIVRLEQIREEISFTAAQRLQVDGHLKKKTFIDADGIRRFVRSIHYPVYFMDFETFRPAVPLYDRSSPYQQIPFQYSLHYKRDRRSKPEHFEFLAEPKGDPRIPFIESLLSATKNSGDILTYNQAFEKRILTELAADFPKYKKEIEKRLSRIKDLMVPFQQNLYYKPRMNGSYSIKAVLPALIPQLSYENLEIQEGDSASNAFEQIIFDSKADTESIRKNLLAYCEMDTFAMVKIWEHLEKI